MVAARPVIRCRIDSDIVYMNLYTPRCGESGRGETGRGEFIQKSTQRPLRSQSPKRVGSGPFGPPISARLSGAGVGSPGAGRTSQEEFAARASEGSKGWSFGAAANSARIPSL